MGSTPESGTPPTRTPPRRTQLVFPSDVRREFVRQVRHLRKLQLREDAEAADFMALNAKVNLARALCSALSELMKVIEKTELQERMDALERRFGILPAKPEKQAEVTQ